MANVYIITCFFYTAGWKLPRGSVEKDLFGMLSVTPDPVYVYTDLHPGDEILTRFPKRVKYFHVTNGTGYLSLLPKCESCVFYYSGHSVKMYSQGYSLGMIMPDGKPLDVKRLFALWKTAHLIYDSCYSGTVLDILPDTWSCITSCGNKERSGFGLSGSAFTSKFLEACKSGTAVSGSIRGGKQTIHIKGDFPLGFNGKP